MTELDKLEIYLAQKKIPYKRLDGPNHREYISAGWHQIIVYDENGKRIWDAVSSIGSYGYSRGLLEIMGSPVVNSEEGPVVGYLTAADVIKRIEKREQK